MQMLDSSEFDLNQRDNVNLFGILDVTDENCSNRKEISIVCNCLHLMPQSFVLHNLN